MTFHLDEFTYDVQANVAGRFPPGETVKVSVKSGDVLRVLDTAGPFGDAVVLGFREDGECKVSRPYAYASGVGTTGPTVLLGAETITYVANAMKHLLTAHVKRGEGFKT